MQGTITDPRAARWPRKVTIVNQETGVSRDNGERRGGLLSNRPASLRGSYTVTVEATGFKKSVTKDVVVEADSGGSMSPYRSAQCRISHVTASTEALQTENANTAGTMSAQEIQRLPQVRTGLTSCCASPLASSATARTAGNGNAVNLPNNSGPGGSISSIFKLKTRFRYGQWQRTASNTFTIDGV